MPAATPALTDVQISVAGVALKVNNLSRFDAKKGFIIGLAAVPAPGAGEKTVKIKVPVSFKVDAKPVMIQGEGPILPPEDEQPAALDSLKKEVAADKPDSQKDIFVGLNVAAPSGGAAAGEGELHFNGLLSSVSSNLRVNTNLQKSSTDGSDLKTFDIGLVYSMQHSLLNGDLASIRSGSTADQIVEAMEKIRKHVLLGIGVDGAGRVEGQAMNFDVTNAVVDLPLQITSRTLGSGSGHFFFRLLPAGVEAGRNLRTEDDKQKAYPIARYKAGGSFGLYWKAKDQQNSPIKKILFDSQAVTRYLFENESAYDATTKKATAVAKGHYFYVQAQLKVYLADTDQGAYAFRVSYDRGGLPPVFSNVKTFRYGFVFESAPKK
jgi:hypothetical protein